MNFAIQRSEYPARCYVLLAHKDVFYPMNIYSSSLIVARFVGREIKQVIFLNLLQEKIKKR